MRQTSNLAAVTGVALIALAGARLIWSLPKPLVLLLGSSLLLWVLVRWWRQQRRPRSLLGGAILLFAPWALVLGLTLGVLTTVDRGGWLWLQVTGYDRVYAETLETQIDITVADFLIQHPIFQRAADNDNHLVLPAGDYTFRETVIIPRMTALTIKPGATLRFGPGRSLISYSPLTARGTEEKPIRFTAQYTLLKWGAVGIVNSGPAIFEYVIFEHGREAIVNQIEFVASLTIINTETEIVNSRFLSAYGKDATNVKYGNVVIRDNLFRDAYKDCLDLDGGAGEISHNQFINCDDEGIDLSENEQVDVFANTILDQRGGRIAADVNLDAIRAANTLGTLDSP